MRIFSKFPQFEFQSGDTFRWSPTTNTIVYDGARVATGSGLMALLHEISHAVLGHSNYQWDVQLLRMEAEAWEKTEVICRDEEIHFDSNQMQDCLESYRQWIYQRSLCPNCNNTGIQQSSDEYACVLCDKHWGVPASQVCRITRRSK